MFDTAFQADAFASDAFQIAAQPIPVPPGGYGDYAEDAKKARKRRDEEIKRDRDEKKRLRKLIAEAIDPSIKEAKKVEVVATGASVEVKADNGDAFRIDVPDLIDATEVYTLVMQALERAHVEAARIIGVNEARKQREAAERERLRIAKRQREDEMLLLL